MKILNFICYYIGRHSQAFRIFYYKYTNHKWLWGIIGFIKDQDKLPVETYGLPENFNKQDFDKFIETMFKS